MELRQYWQLLRRWLWLVALTTLLAAAAAYVVSIRQTPIYQASTRMLVTQGSSSSTTITSYNDILINERLSRTYAQMLTARPILQATLDRVGLLEVAPAALAQSITVTPVRDTQLIDVKVEHPVPALAAELANTLPEVFIQYNNDQQAARFQESKQALQTQLANLDSDLQDTERKLALLDEADSAEAEAQRVSLGNRLAQYRSSYGNVLAQLESIRLAEANARDTITVIEPADPPRNPIRPRPLMNTLLAAVVGAMLGLGTVFLIEYLDDTVKSPDDVARISGLSTVGVIAKQRSDGNGPGLITVEQPRSPIAEAYRAIRTGIQFSSIDKPVRTLVVTSSGPSEGKSTTAANLAVVMAQAGKRVVLIDADLRKPTQHKRWGVANTVGLTGALLFDESHMNFEQLLQKTKVENLWLVTCGQIPHNPSELLGSQKLVRLAERLLEEFDLLIFDTPPTLAVTDPVVLARAMDGVLVVADADTTREPALAQTLVELERVQAHVLGVVLNKFKARGDSGYYYYYYDRYRYYTEDEKEGKGGKAAAADQSGARRPKIQGMSQRLLRAMRRP